jgi:hypothetical protein
MRPMTETRRLCWALAAAAFSLALLAVVATSAGRRQGRAAPTQATQVVG